MPILKPISGHTSCKGPYRYLTKNGRALASDYLNLEVPDKTLPGDVFSWWKAMDQTRHDHHHDRPWGNRPARTYKHYIISPDPGDEIDLASLRELSVAWAEKHFGDHECAIVYHNDNERSIPHAHVIVNSTNLATGNRLRDEDPSALNRSLQRLADDRHLSRFGNMEGQGLTAQERIDQRTTQPRSLQAEYMRRAEVRLKAEGAYSWVADIRARVKVARSVARSEAEFRSLLGELGVQVGDNSAKAKRADWIYALKETPTRRVSGEKLGLSYGKESLLARFGQKGLLDESGGRRVAEIARSAVTVRDLVQLQRLADAVALIERGQIRSVVALDVYMRRPYEKQAWGDLSASQAVQAQGFARKTGMLPLRTPRSAASAPTKSDEVYARMRPMRRSEQSDDDVRARQHEGRSAQARRRDRNEQER